MPVPAHTKFFNPTFQAIKRLGGSALIAELNEEVIKNISLTQDELSQTHDGRQTEVEYRLAWARTYLKVYGILDNSARGVWVLTQKGREIDSVDPNEVRRFVGQRSYKSRLKSKEQRVSIEELPELVETSDAVQLLEAKQEQSWQEKLWDVLVNLKPDAFERLCQRLLRESGFVQVNVTGRTGDGGIDGTGIIRIGGLITFPIIFQCKRYKGSVNVSTIRDFRGAMVGRADRGLIITTGTFTADAKKEATRDGAPPVDLVDGTQLLEKLKELCRGIEIKMVEEVTIDADWFKTL